MSQSAVSQELIYVTYSNAQGIPYLSPDKFADHIALHYIDSDGNHSVVDAKPTNSFSSNLGKLGALFREEFNPARPNGGLNNSDSEFGAMRTELREGDANDDSLPSEIIKRGG